MTTWLDSHLNRLKDFISLGFGSSPVHVVAEVTTMLKSFDLTPSLDIRPGKVLKAIDTHISYKR
jgi:hypothetical protein